MKFLTHLAGTPLVVAPQTIGPFTKPRSRWLARATLKLSALVATRDQLSTKAARDMGLTRDIVEASDVALRLPYDAPAPRPPGTPTRVGLNVSGLLMAGGYTGKNEFGLKMDYPALIRGLITYFRDHADGCEIHLVPHVFPTSPLQGTRTTTPHPRRWPPNFPGPCWPRALPLRRRQRSYIAGMDFFMGARMHACIAACSSGVPVAPMAYSRKFAGLFGSIGYDHTIDCTSASAEDVHARITELYANRASLAEEARSVTQTGLSKLKRYEDALAELLGGLGQ